MWHFREEPDYLPSLESSKQLIFRRCLATEFGKREQAAAGSHRSSE